MVTSAEATLGQTGILVAFDLENIIDAGLYDPDNWTVTTNGLGSVPNSVTWDSPSTLLVDAQEGAPPLPDVVTVSYDGGDPTLKYEPDCPLAAIEDFPVTVNV